MRAQGGGTSLVRRSGGPLISIRDQRATLPPGGRSFCPTESLFEIPLGQKDLPHGGGVGGRLAYRPKGFLALRLLRSLRESRPYEICSKFRRAKKEAADEGQAFGLQFPSASPGWCFPFGR